MAQTNDFGERHLADSPVNEIERSLRGADVSSHPALARLRGKLEVQDRSGDGGGGNYSRSCFPTGTQILLGDRMTKAIEELSIGDVVMGFDGKNPLPVIVEALESPLRDHFCVLSFADGSTVKLTREHPLYTTEGWRSLSPESTAEENAQLLVGKLEIGDHVLNAAGEYRTLMNVRIVSDEIQTYNLKRLSRFDTFYANGFLVHNKAQMTMCGKCGPRFADFACIASPALCLPPPMDATGRIGEAPNAYR
jgi:hypothetical protein